MELNRKKKITFRLSAVVFASVLCFWSIWSLISWKIPKANGIPRFFDAAIVALGYFIIISISKTKRIREDDDLTNSLFHSFGIGVFLAVFCVIFSKAIPVYINTHTNIGLCLLLMLGSLTGILGYVSGNMGHRIRSGLIYGLGLSCGVVVVFGVIDGTVIGLVYGILFAVAYGLFFVLATAVTFLALAVLALAVWSLIGKWFAGVIKGAKVTTVKNYLESTRICRWLMAK